MFSWQNLSHPFFVLAPMENVTDTVFRQIVMSCGAPDVFFTEFTNTNGICSVGRKEVEKRLLYTEKERPLIAQIWGNNPEHFFETAKYIHSLGFDGIDINLGCPDRAVMKQGSCAALILNIPLVTSLIEQTKKGANGLPVSIKTRIGINKIQTEEWITFLLEQDIDALTIHGRTAKEQSLVPAHWDEIGKAVEIRNKLGVKTKLIGNGDIVTRKQAEEMIEKYQLDGIMIGRGIFQNTWIFNPKIEEENITPLMRLEKLQEHLDLFETTWGETKQFATIKKFVKAYVHSFDGASLLRASLMEAKTMSEMQGILKKTLFSF